MAEAMTTSSSHDHVQELASLQRQALELAQTLDALDAKRAEVKTEKKRALSGLSSRDPRYKTIYSRYYRVERKLLEDQAKIASKLLQIVRRAAEIIAEAIRTELELEPYAIVVEENNISTMYVHCRVLLAKAAAHGLADSDAVKQRLLKYGLCLAAEPRRGVNMSYLITKLAKLSKKYGIPVKIYLAGLGEFERALAIKTGQRLGAHIRENTIYLIPEEISV